MLVEQPRLGGTSEVRRRRGRWRVWLARAVYGGLGVGIVVAVVLAYLPDPVSVDLAVVERGPMEVTVKGDGYARVRDRYVVSAPITARLLRIELEPGDTVEAGQVLARFAPATAPLLDRRARAEGEARVAGARAGLGAARAALASARAEHALAKRDLTRKEGLAAQQIITREELDRLMVAVEATEAARARAEFGVRRAERDVQLAKAALLAASEGTEPEAATVVAPVGGVILERHVQSEGVVAAGAPMFELGDLERLEVVVDLLTQDAVSVEVGAPARVVIGGLTRPLAGRVRRVEPSAYTRVSALGVEEQRVDVLIDLEGSGDGWRGLKDGYRVDVHVRTWAGQDVLRVPAGAVFRHGDGWAVFRVEGGSKAVQTAVEVGADDGRTIEVKAGLEAGDVVVVYPSEDVVNGGEVRAREQAAPRG